MHGRDTWWRPGAGYHFAPTSGGWVRFYLDRFEFFAAALARRARAHRDPGPWGCDALALRDDTAYCARGRAGYIAVTLGLPLLARLLRELGLSIVQFWKSTT